MVNIFDEEKVLLIKNIFPQEENDIYDLSLPLDITTLVANKFVIKELECDFEDEYEDAAKLANDNRNIYLEVTKMNEF